jgi:hypothetical protein
MKDRVDEGWPLAIVWVALILSVPLICFALAFANHMACR